MASWVLMPALWNALAFAVLGIAIFGVSVFLVIRSLPGNLWKRALDEQNTAATILLASLILGLAWIVASVVH